MHFTHAGLINPHFACVSLSDHGRLHVFCAGDGPDADPHDHAEWGFWSEVKLGGYVEELFDLNDGSLGMVERKQGDRFRVESWTIHRIVHLTSPFCVTHVAPDVHTPVPHAHAYQFREDGVFWRPVFGGEWTRIR